MSTDESRRFLQSSLSTIHLAFGHNVTFGGQIEAGVHIDLVIKEPDVYLDEEKFMEKGILLVR